MKNFIYAKLFKSCHWSQIIWPQIIWYPIKSGRIGIDPRILTVGIALSLSGCMGVYEGGFECPPGEGVGCKSISEVNEMVNQGLGTKKQESSNPSSKEPREGVCEKGSSCPLTPDSAPEIWYAPRVLRDESLRNKALLEV